MSASDHKSDQIQRQGINSFANFNINPQNKLAYCLESSKITFFADAGSIPAISTDKNKIVN